MPKPDLVRIARSPRGDVAVDAAGSAPGRGAYVHPDPGCLRAALGSGALGRALRVGLGESEVGKLRNELKELVGAK